MELVRNPNPAAMILEESQAQNPHKSNFIEANTEKVTLQHLKNECIIPVFSKDNETTLSHYEFIHKANEVITSIFPEYITKAPDIRVSHVVKGRVPSAIGKPAKELQDHEKTIYYERCAFLINLPNCKQIINGNELSLSIGGVRAYNQENLYSKKSLEKFKVFIGFQNRVCTNLCISTDGFSNELRVSSINELEDKKVQLFSSYDRDSHLKSMQQIGRYKLSEKQFAHLIGKLRMYQHLEKQEQNEVFQISLNDSQINNVVKDYYKCENFSRELNGEIGLWQLYNLFTEANKSSYIDSNLERNVNAYELVNSLAYSLETGGPNWFLHN